VARRPADGGLLRVPGGLTRARRGLAVAAALATAALALAGSAPARLLAQPTPGAPAPAPGLGASPRTVAELRSAVGLAIQRFEALDAPGVLALVSEHYRTGPLTKPALREQLTAVYGLYDAVKAQVRIDEVRMVGDHAWVYSTGEVSGRVRILGQWMVFLSWSRELEIARREAGAWRLYGYQQ
jgi:hypothetical protein